ncbi:MAG: NAD(P)-dependent oxidoreductase [Oxalobacteraceae bacterium]|jgi:putative dehydrogenase|nr:NAD(P)-dependent oxidoreductase [Oxalobacteraceae bacterium]
MKKIKTIGVIGAGSMGMAIALNLQQKGYGIVIRDIRTDVENTARNHGLVVADSPAELAAKSDFILIIVVNAAQAHQVLFGVNGVSQIAPENKTIMISSTIAPDDTEIISKQLINHGFSVLDAPVSGGPVRARDGTMSLMLAGEDSVIAHHSDVLQAISDRIFRLGSRLGDGARYKLINNLVAGINLVAASEAVALAKHMGLDTEKMVALMSASSGQSMMLDDRLPRALANDYAPRAYAYILTKDVALGLRMAESVGTDSPMAAHALEIFKATLARGFDELDDSAVLKTLLD